MTTTQPMLDIQLVPPLTPKQLAVAIYLRSYLMQNDNMPTCRQIASDLGFEANNAAEEYKKVLIKKGVLEHYTDHEDPQGKSLHHGGYRFARTAVGAAHLRSIDYKRHCQSIDAITAIRLANAIYDQEGKITK